MPIPKIMLSSTCFDLKQIRENLETFIKSMGYDPIRSDKGDIGYNIATTLQEDCYLSAQQCDILVGIIGGTFGSEASAVDSISMKEMNTALENKKQIYLFVDDRVSTERGTYNSNLEENGEEFAKIKMKYKFVNDTRIFDFINRMYEHQSERVVIFEFKTSADISEILQKQWANLFQAFLSQKERDMQSSAYSKINESSDKLEKLAIEFENNLGNFKSGSAFLLDNITYFRFIYNPIIKYLKEDILKTGFTIIFKSYDEFVEIMDLFGYTSKEDNKTHYIFSNKPNVYFDVEYSRILCNKNLFKDGNLIFPDTNKGIGEFLFIEQGDKPGDFFATDEISDDDDLPF